MSIPLKDETEYVDAETMHALADSKELPTIMRDIANAASRGQHRHIVKEMNSDTAHQLAKLGYHVDTYTSVDGPRFEIKW